LLGGKLGFHGLEGFRALHLEVNLVKLNCLYGSYVCLKFF
jgi:hypothetical protein